MGRGFFGIQVRFSFLFYIYNGFLIRPLLRPERWESTPEAAASIPGIWGNMLTFLGGPRACIGYRFALVEYARLSFRIVWHIGLIPFSLFLSRMKALLFTLIRAFEFELAVPPEDIAKRTALVQRPIVLSDPDGGHQMPLLLKPVHQI